jgi:hypothetical protein
MGFPAFFDDVVDIVVHDPLAALLGAADDGRITYRYVDAVKLAGHSCPTVAGAWLITARALARLYPEALPQRGNIRVELRAAADEGAAGVTAAVIALVTGAAGDGGFKGIAGLHSRRNLLAHGAAVDADVRFTRLDTQQAVAARYRPERVPMPDSVKALLGKAVARVSEPAFAESWQGWVRSILIDHRDDPALVELTP